MLMVLTWALTTTGFVLIFVELKAWSAARNPHAILGVITTAICFIQPIGAYFRPHPGTSKRPVFNWIHWLGGNVAHILASKCCLKLQMFGIHTMNNSSRDNIFRCEVIKSRASRVVWLDSSGLCGVPCYHASNSFGKYKLEIVFV